MAVTRAVRFLRFCEIGFWVAGLSLLLLWAGVRAWGEAGRLQGVAQIEQALAHSPEVIQTAAVGTAVDWLQTLSADPDPDQTMWSQSRVRAYRESVLANARLPAGLLQIPKIDLKLPLYEDATEVNQNRGLTRIAGTAGLRQVGNIGIAGHRDGYFRGLKDLVVGDQVELKTIGVVSQYRVSSIEIVDPSDVRVLEPTVGGSITLVTCYPFYFVGHAPKRYIVKAISTERMLLESGDIK